MRHSRWTRLQFSVWLGLVQHATSTFGCAEAGPAADGGDARSAGAEGDAQATPMPAATSGASGGERESSAKLAGSFTLSLVAPVDATDSTPARDAQSAFIGSAADGPVPVAMTWVSAQKADGCTLYTPQPLFCDPPCGASAVCVTDHQCLDYPTTQTLGTIRLSGLASGDVSMLPIAGKYQPPAGRSLAFPPCAEGDEVELAVDGANYTPFTLSTRCISALDFRGPIKITRGAPLELSWHAPGKTDVARIQVHVDISHHGGARGKIDCDVTDSGSLQIPAALVDELVDLGVAGFPTVVVTRISTGGVKVGDANQVKLQIQASIEREIEIDELMSCTEDSQCVAPKTCQADLTCK